MLFKPTLKAAIHKGLAVLSEVGFSSGRCPARLNNNVQGNRRSKEWLEKDERRRKQQKR
jgi:hypothetical protein